MHRRRFIFALLGTSALAATSLSQLSSFSSSATTSSTTAYTTTGSANVDGVSGGPWNTSQGDPSEGSPYASSDLFPTYTPGGATTTIGGVTEPNLAVYPAASNPTPYPSGVAGTPGPLPGYCTSGGANPETGSVASQPSGTLPFSPYYFPDVVRNANGSLTGYFDYRPKDADEATTVATSTDNGKTWVTMGEALDENPAYCPTANVNDDGEGHPYVTSVGSSSYLYTLQRPAGDNTGIGLLVHGVNQSASDPLSGVPATEKVGVDPNTFATSSVNVTSSAMIIPVSTLGMAGSPEQIVAGPFEDTASPSSIITCTGTGANTLTGCSSTSPVSVTSGDDLVQVIATANPGSTSTYSIPQDPNNPAGSGGLANLKFTNATTVTPLTTYVMNLNAPNRIYIDGATVYCTQANANPTTKLEDCTTTKAGGLTVSQGDAITADPIVPATAQMTSGLVSPDGVVGTLPSYSGAPSGSTVVLYTEKILNYFIDGVVNGSVSSGKLSSTLTLPSGTINYSPGVASNSNAGLPTSGSFTISLGSTSGGVANPIQQVTCTGMVSAAGITGAPAGSQDLTGCTGGIGTVAVGNYVGDPSACTAAYSTLSQIGEGNNGASKGPEKLFGNNEDLTVLRAAYTTDGVHFTDLGPISGTNTASSSYNDVSNPNQTASPSATAPTNLAPGATDATELRFVGSRGTIITNPDGSEGMFLSGAWCSDGDSDAFNQIFYTSSTDGKTWTTPKVVLSTDYTFAASQAQDANLANSIDSPLGVSAYYSGRAYGPSVVQNPDGSLTMVFSGYRLPKPIASAGTQVGTSSTPYTVGTTDPALYRNILTINLSSATSPGVATKTTVTSSAGATVQVGEKVTYTATVTVPRPGTGLPTGTVKFTDGSGQISGCNSQPVSDTANDTATCDVTYTATQSPDNVTAVYSGDSNYGTSTGTFSETVTKAATTLKINSANPLEVAATLTRTDDGSAVKGQLVTFSIAGLVVCAGTTDSTGTAFCNPIASVLLDLSPLGYDTNFAGTSYYGSSHAHGGITIKLGLALTGHAVKHGKLKK